MSNITVNEQKKKTALSGGAAPAPQNINQVRNAPAPVFTAEDAEELLKSPLSRHVVEKDPNFTLTVPAEADLVDAYEASSLFLTDSASKRKSALKDSKKKYDLQEALIRKERNPLRRQRPAAVKRISLKSAINLSDRELVEHFGEYSTGNNNYLATRYALLKNKYYSLLPENEMRKLSRFELLSRLRELYEKEPEHRNTELILYYQSLIILMDHEKEAEGKKKEPAVTRVRPSVAQLKKDNGAGLKRNEKAIKDLCLSPEETEERMKLMKSVMVPENDAQSWMGDKEDRITPSQKEGIRQVLAWMYRNCSKSSESKEPFVHKLASAQPEKLLLMFYLIENGMHESLTSSVLHTAVTEYTPDLDVFKSRVVASKAKFWKRIGFDSSDSVIDWSMMGNVARFVLQNDIAEDYAKYSKENAEAEEKLKDPANNSDEAKANILLELVNKKGNLLITLYRSTGLSPDMPLTLIADKKLRTRVASLLIEFKKTAADLVDLLKRTGAGDGAGVRAAVKYGAGDKEHEEAPEEADHEGETLEKIDAAADTLTVAASYDDVITLMGDTLESITDTTLYGTGTGGLNSVIAMLGLASSIGNMYLLSKGASALSAADHTAQALGVTSDFIGSIADLAQGGADIVSKFVDLGEAGDVAGLVEDTVVRTASDAFSTVSGGIQFCTGCVTIAAGALQTVSGGIQLARARSTKNDVKRAEKKLADAQKRANLSQEDKDDQETLRAFLKHQKNVAADQQVSATVSMVSGALKMVGGALTVAGILAPVGAGLALLGTLTDIGFGIFYARKRKNVTIRKAVDEALKTEDHMKALKNSSPEAAKMKDDKLRTMVRQKLLGELGYATVKEMFADVNRKTAHMLYERVFEKGSADPDYDMYLNALKSLGTKIRIPKNAGDKPFPTEDVIYSKLME